MRLIFISRQHISCIDAELLRHIDRECFGLLDLGRARSSIGAISSGLRQIGTPSLRQ
jgi:hypothetical protein